MISSDRWNIRLQSRECVAAPGSVLRFLACAPVQCPSRPVLGVVQED